MGAIFHLPERSNTLIKLRLIGPCDDLMLKLAFRYVLQCVCIPKVHFDLAQEQSEVSVEDPLLEDLATLLDTEEGVRCIALEEVTHLFDKSIEQPVRARLLRLGQEDYVLILIAKRSLIDERSLEIIVEWH